MGDISDYYRDLALASGQNPYPAPHKNGAYDGISRERGSPAIIYDTYEFTTIVRPRRKKGIRCALCGKTGLNWQQVKGSKWRLHDGQAVHVCMPTATGFGESSGA